MALLRLLKNLFLVWRSTVIWGLLLAGVIVAWCVLQRNAIWEYLDTQEMRDKEKMRVEKLEHEIEQLQNERETLSRVGDEHELVARKTYRLSKPGEEVLYLKMPSETKVTTETSASQTKTEPDVVPDSPSAPGDSEAKPSLPRNSLALPHALPASRPALPGR
jgi:cell division protein FtsB